MTYVTSVQKHAAFWRSLRHRVAFGRGCALVYSCVRNGAEQYGEVHSSTRMCAVASSGVPYLWLEQPAVFWAERTLQGEKGKRGKGQYTTALSYMDKPKSLHGHMHANEKQKTASTKTVGERQGGEKGARSLLWAPSTIKLDTVNGMQTPGVMFFIPSPFCAWTAADCSAAAR